MACRFVQLFKNYILPNRFTFSNFSSSVKSTPKSSLLISGERAVDTFVVVIPYLDFDQRFANFSELEENVKRRGVNFNIVEMKESWDFYKEWNQKKLQLQENLHETGKRLDQISTMEESENKKIEREKIERYRTLLREDLQQVRKNVWHMEDNVVCELLKLPNVLHFETSDKEEELFVFDKESASEGCNHLDIGVKLNCIEYKNGFTCFLKNKAALFELAVPELFVNKFCDLGFIRFSNPDFTRNVLAEGVCLYPNDTSELFLLENTEGNNDHLHLCGGASLFPFCGFHAKQSVPKQSLPVKYITSGRRYTPVTSSLPGLYSVNQSTSVEIFIGTFSEEEMYHEFQTLISTVKDNFIALGLKFRIVKQPPKLMKNWESLRVSIQLFSFYNKVFVEVGHISIIDDFISKRLKMCYTDKKEECFLKVVSGTIINTHTLLALCLEHSYNDLFVPNVVKDYMLK